VTDSDWLAERFEEFRGRLSQVAYRMLGSHAEADDAVQEAWIRFSRTDTSDVENLGGWLTTVVSRVCLNTLQSRRTHPLTTLDREAPSEGSDTPDPEQQAVLADSIGMALLVVLDKLTPAERVAFALHDMFAVPFENIAPIVGRSTAATRQLASRARRRVQGHDPDVHFSVDKHAELVNAFLDATHNGDFTALLSILDPEAVLSADQATVKLGAPASEIRGSEEVASFLRRARGARAVIVDGETGAAWLPKGQLRVLFLFTVSEDKIVAVDLIADPDTLSGLDITI
jgi:RNA polymerase sigma factor (sigma-70 family)